MNRQKEVLVSKKFVFKLSIPHLKDSPIVQQWIKSITDANLFPNPISLLKSRS